MKNKNKIIKTLRKAKQPMDVENVRVSTKIGSWVTAKTTLLELLNEGRINGQKTSKSWIFWTKTIQEPSQSLNSSEKIVSEVK